VVQPPLEQLGVAMATPGWLWLLTIFYSFFFLIYEFFLIYIYILTNIYVVTKLKTRDNHSILPFLFLRIIIHFFKRILIPQIKRSLKILCVSQLFKIVFVVYCLTAIVRCTHELCYTNR
jgi:hypothetical protein